MGPRFPERVFYSIESLRKVARFFAQHLNTLTDVSCLPGGLRRTRVGFRLGAILVSHEPTQQFPNLRRNQWRSRIPYQHKSDHFPVSEWGASTGLDSGEPRWRR